MIRLSDLGQVYIVCGKTDLRKGIDGLGALVQDCLSWLLGSCQKKV